MSKRLRRIHPLRFQSRFKVQLFATLFAALMAGFVAAAQEVPASAGKPTEHVLGTVVSLNAADHSIVVKDDKSGTETAVLLQDAKTLLKVPPGAKDLKTATRITAEDLAAGDRVDVRGFKAAGDPQKIAARVVLLMSGRDLQEAHQQQAEQWRRSTAGVVTAVDAVGGTLTATVRTPDGPKPLSIQTTKSTEFTRYSPASPGAPAASQLSDIQPGDQVRVIGEKSADGGSLAAQRVYSGAFRTLNGTIAAIDPGGKSITLKDLATNKPVTVELTEQSNIRRLPPMMAMGLARHLNPGAARSGGPAGAGANGAAQKAPAEAGPSEAAPSRPAPDAGSQPGSSDASSGSGGAGSRMRGNGDISQMIERLPKIAVTDLKPGDALVVAGAASGGDNGTLTATNVIAGVEPILQSAPKRQGGGAVTGGDWGLGEMSAPQ